MIRRITAIHNTVSEAEYDVLCDLFRELGFQEGETWRSTRQDQSQGTPFSLPRGEVEFVKGIEPATPNTLVEVNRNLEEIHAKVNGFLTRSGNPGIHVSPIELTHWGSRLFSLSFGVPRVPRIGFWKLDTVRARHTVMGPRSRSRT